MKTHPSYRPDIDGLRAIAILSVLFFHTDIPGFSGGFVGVDIFFVISGYLITSIIYRKIENRDFSMARFYERRILRLFPAFFTSALFTFAGAYYLVDSRSLKDVGQSILASTLFASNFLFAKEADYFSSPAVEKPLLHTWSLSIEEQFYLIFPFLLISLARLQGRVRLVLVLATAALSFAVNLLFVETHPSITFYLLPSRAWELLAGAVLALGLVMPPKTGWATNVLGCLGAILIIFSVHYYTDGLRFPGFFAVIPVLGASLVILTGIGDKESVVKKVLAYRGLVFFGLISYSLYLWHWPLVAFAKYHLSRRLAPTEGWFIIFLSIGIATLSWRFIEQPFRSLGKEARQGGRVFYFGFAASISLLALGLVTHVKEGLRFRFPDLEAAAIHLPADPQWVEFEKNEAQLHKLKYGYFPRVIGNTNATPTFALWGDSHAFALWTGLHEKAQEFGAAGYLLGHSHNLKPLLGFDGLGKEPYGIDESNQNDSVLKFIADHPKIRKVILAGGWGWEPPHISDTFGEVKTGQEYEKFLEVGLTRTVRALKELGCEVFIATDVPLLKVSPNRTMWISRKYNFTDVDIQNAGITLDEYLNYNRGAVSVLGRLQHRYSIVVLRLEERFFVSGPTQSKVIHEGKSLYVDNNHLSTHGSRFVKPVFDRVFAEKGEVVGRAEFKGP